MNIVSSTRQQAISTCLECHLICQETLAYHGDETGGKQLSSQHIKRLMATIELCQVTANMLIIHAPMIDQLCELCARVCEQCATSCAAIDISAMQKCAAACQRCTTALYEESSRLKQAA